MALPARRLEVPAGFTLTNEQIVALLEHANARAARGDVFDVTAGPPAFTVQIALGAQLEKEEILCALTRLNQAKAAGHADVSFSFANSKMVKRGWLLLKDPSEDDQLGPLPVSLGGVRVKEF